MKILVTRQNYSFRGPIPPLRIQGVQYIFQWDTALKAYAWEAKTWADVNRLLKDNEGARMFIPGVTTVDETSNGVKAEEIPVAVKHQDIPNPPPIPEPEKIASRPRTSYKKK